MAKPNESVRSAAAAHQRSLPTGKGASGCSIAVLSCLRGTAGTTAVNTLCDSVATNRFAPTFTAIISLARHATCSTQHENSSTYTIGQLGWPLLCGAAYKHRSAIGSGFPSTITAIISFAANDTPCCRLGSLSSSATYTTHRRGAAVPMMESVSRGASDRHRS